MQNPIKQISESTKFKKVNMYEIRCYTNETGFSRGLGRKLRTYNKACKIVRRLKKSGIDAFKNKFEIIIVS